MNGSDANQLEGEENKLNLGEGYTICFDTSDILNYSKVEGGEDLNSGA